MVKKKYREAKSEKEYFTRKKELEADPEYNELNQKIATKWSEWSELCDKKRALEISYGVTPNAGVKFNP